MLAENAGSEGGPIRFAVIGCGAATRLYAAPALADLERRRLARATAIYDPDSAAARSILAILPEARAVPDLRTAFASAELALIASPPALHRDQAVEALRSGLHVFCEKPLAVTVADADAIVAGATAAQRHVGVGMIRRHLSATRAVRALLQAGVLGRLRSISWFEGGPFAWPVSSPSYFRRELCGGGVLQDLGTHAIDLLAWWCGPPTLVDYADDAMGGVEANASLHLRAGGADVRMRLSRDWGRPNMALIEGEHGSLEWTINEPLRVGLRLAVGEVSGVFQEDATSGPTDFVSAYRAQLIDFVEAVRAERAPAVPASAGRDVCAFVDRCYRHRRLLAMPWFSDRERRAAASGRRW